MTDREAIECFESDCENCSVKDECKRLKEKGKLVCRNTSAISAIQERIDREKGCVLCFPNRLCGTCKKMLDYYDDGGSDKCSAEMMGKACADYTPMAACPMCGRKLKTAMPEEETT